MKSHGMIMNIHMKPLQQYYILYAALIFGSLDEILWCDHSNETSSVILSHGRTIYFVCSSNFCESVNEIQWRDHSNEITSAVLWHSTIYLVLTFESVDKLASPTGKNRLVGWKRQAEKKTAVLPNGEENGHVIISWCFINTLSIAFYFYLFVKKNCGHSKRHAWRRHTYIGDG